MKHKIDIASWKRKEQFHFFRSMSDPFTGVVANLECRNAYNKAKEMKTSFWLYYLHQSLHAANLVEEFRYRLEEEEVVCYDKIHAGTTVDNAKKTFSFAFLNYHELYTDFAQEAMPQIEEVRAKSEMNFGDDQRRADCIHYTSVPWISFTSLKHASHLGNKNSCPKISFGKYFEENEKLWLPVSVEVHHALMDGRQIGEFYDIFQSLLKE